MVAVHIKQLEMDKNNKEIDLIALAISILKEWKFMARFVVIGAIIGLVVALNTPKQYKSEVELAPEFSSASLGISDNLSDIASTFGINLGGKTSVDAIYPDLYPDIFTSTDFIMSLYEVPIRTTTNDTPRPYLDYLLKESKVPFWNYPSIWIKSMLAKTKAAGGKVGATDNYYISKTNWDIIKLIRSLVTCSVDKKTSVITISVIDQDPLAAAILTDTLQNRLQSYITDYKTAKTRIDIAHYKKLVAETKDKYRKARSKYIASSDGNQKAYLMSTKAKTEDYKNEMDQEYEIFTQYLAQLRLSEARLQERTPAFTVIQRAVTNQIPVSTPRIFTMILWVFLSCAIGVIWILYGREFYRNTIIKKT